jgi:hypothetical protein
MGRHMEKRNPKEVASHVAQRLTELAQMPREAGLETLAYLLDIARLEAASQAGRPEAL